MRDITGATLFSGFEGVGMGMRAAGIRHLWGIESRDDVANVARLNGFHSITADILTVNPATMERPDILHASPPCTNASVANAKAGETDLDRALAYKTAQFIEVLQPEIFTLENVTQYRKFDAFKFILTTLERLGYWVDVQHVNAADFGVPQSRRRMILRARLGGWLPHLPEPVQHVGWYEAIEDLIPTLPASKFAPWQLSRLPEKYKTYLLMTGNTNTADAAPGNGVLEVGEPANTVMSGMDRLRVTAFILGNGNRSAAVMSHEPSDTVTANHNQATMHAFIVDGKLSTSGDEKRLQIIAPDDPSATAVSSMSALKDVRIFTGGRVVSMTPRALARFQSFPDWYQLPEKKALACFGIGNAVPPKMIEAIYNQLVPMLQEAHNDPSL